MELQKKETLEKAGIDVDNAMERFLNNEAMFEKYLKRFAENTTYEELVGAIESKDCAQAFETTHALKGNTGTLSIAPLFKLFSKQTDFFRAGDFDGGAAMMDEVSAEYKKVIEVIKAAL